MLIGYDKHPHGSDDPAGAEHEPVFRYSVRVREGEWFAQEIIGRVYWFTVVAVCTDPKAANYPSGWTNHKHVFQDDAVAGHVYAGGVWNWQPLKDQTGQTEVMSFILFTDPE